MHTFYRGTLLLLFLAPGWVTAQDLLVLEPITIVETPARAGQIEPENVTGGVTVLTRESLQGRAASVAEVLEQVPGVQITRSSGLGSFSTVSLRGSDSQQVSVFVNGIKVSGGVGGAVDLSQFLLSAVERIEVYRGRTPLTLGLNPVGGAINIITRRADDAPEAVLQAGYGSFDTRQAAFALRQGLGPVQADLNVDHLASENDFELTNDNRTPANPEDDREEPRRNADFQQTQILANLLWSRNTQQDLRLLLGWNDKEQGVPSLFNLESDRTRLDTRSYQIQAAWSQIFASGLSSTLRPAWQQQRQIYDDRAGQIGLRQEWERSDSERLSLDWDLQQVLASQPWSLRLAGSRETLQTQDLNTGTTRVDSTRDLLELGLAHDWFSDDGRWQVSGSLSSAWLDDQSGVLKDREAHASGGLGLRWDMHSDWHLTANLSRAVRLPTLLERFGNQGLLLGNPTLTPETALNLDAGLNYAAAGGMELSAQGYIRALEDAISVSYNSQGVGRFLNIGEGRVLGLELSARLPLGERWQLQFDSTLQDSENRSARRDQQGQALPNIREQLHQLSAVWRNRQWSAQLTARAERGGFYDNTGALALPDTDVLDSQLRWQAGAYALTLRAENLTDEATEEVNGYPGPGRSIFLVVEATTSTQP